MVQIKKDNIKEAVTSESEKVQRLFDYSLGLTDSIAKTQRTIDFLKSDNRNIANSPNIIYTLSTIENIEGIKLIDKNGIVAASNDNQGIGEKPKDTKYTDAIVKSDENNGLLIHKNLEEKTDDYILFSKVTDSEGSYLGFVEMIISPLEVYNNLDKTTLHDAGDVMVVGENGIVLYSTEEEDFSKSLWTLNSQEKRSIAKENDLETFEVDSLQYEELKLPIINYKGPSSFEFKCAADDFEEEIASVAKVGSYPLYLVSEVEKEDISADILRGTDALSLISLFAIIVGASIVTKLLYWQLKPLKIIKKTIESIKNNNLEQDIPVKSQDEFREIADDLSEITSELKKCDCINCIHKNPDQNTDTKEDVIKESRFTK